MNWLDVKYSFRQMLRDRMFTFVALLSLALGIGATTSVFSAIYGVLWSPFPYRAAERMVKPTVMDATGHESPFALSRAQFLEFSKARCLDGAPLWDDWDMFANNGGMPEAVHTGQFSPQGFDFLAVPALTNSACASRSALRAAES